LLLVRQAEQLVGKSFLELIRILVPAHAEQAKVQIGQHQAFTLPLVQPETETSNEFGATSSGNNSLSNDNAMAPAIEASTRQEAVTLLDEVGDFYRTIEPSSPIPLFTDRARSLVERDFMGLLKDLLPDAEFSAGAGSK
jgi:type VI secretion system protein ImpA